MTPQESVRVINIHMQKVVGAEIVSATPYMGYADTLELLLRIPKDRTQWHHLTYRLLQGLTDNPPRALQLTLGTKYLLKAGKMVQGGSWILSGGPIPLLLEELAERVVRVEKVRTPAATKIPLIQPVDFAYGKRGGAFASKDSSNPMEFVLAAGPQGNR